MTTSRKACAHDQEKGGGAKETVRAIVSPSYAWPRQLPGSSPAVVCLYRRRTPIRHLPGDTPTSGSLSELRSFYRLPPAHRHALPTSSSPTVDLGRPDEHAPRDPRCGQRTVRETLGLMCLALVLATPARSLSDVAPATVANGNVEQAPSALPTETEVESVTVEIRSRIFIPNHVLLHHDRKTVLRFRNHDTELHTVVAKELFLRCRPQRGRQRSSGVRSRRTQAGDHPA